jgi:hypothetical protein
MWRCHCGETNLNKDPRCRECAGPRVTHEDKERDPRPRERRKTVNVGFFGMGLGDDSRTSAAGRRPMSEHELDSYYRRSHRRSQLMWVVYAAAAAAAIGLLIWQVTRPG